MERAVLSAVRVLPASAFSPTCTSYHQPLSSDSSLLHTQPSTFAVYTYNQSTGMGQLDQWVLRTTLPSSSAAPRYNLSSTGGGGGNPTAAPPTPPSLYPYQRLSLEVVSPETVGSTPFRASNGSVIWSVGLVNGEASDSVSVLYLTPAAVHEGWSSSYLYGWRQSVQSACALSNPWLLRSVQSNSMGQLTFVLSSTAQGYYITSVISITATGRYLTCANTTSSYAPAVALSPVNATALLVNNYGDDIQLRVYSLRDLSAPIAPARSVRTSTLHSGCRHLCL